MKQILRGLLGVLCGVILVGCTPAAAQAPASGSMGQGAMATPAGGYPGPMGQGAGGPGRSSTAYPAMPQPTGYPAPGGPGNTPEGKTVTLEQNGQTLSLKKDETFLLKLGEIYQWEIQIDRPDVISRIPNIAVIKGAQGIYKANQPGTATLNATGDPLCRQSKPACMMPSVQFSVQIMVQP